MSLRTGLAVFLLSSVGLILAAPASKASFWLFRDCVLGCNARGGYWSQLACIDDCFFELVKEYKELAPATQYSSTIEPSNLLRNPGHPADEDTMRTQFSYLIGQDLPVTLYLANADANYLPGAGAAVRTQADYLAFENAHQYTGASSITNVEVRAIPYTAAQSLPDSPVSVFADPVWNTATVLYNGPNSGMVLNAHSMGANIYVLRIKTSDSINGVQYGAVRLTLTQAVPGISSLGLILMALALVANGAWIVVRRSRFRVSA